jgi:uncharacterized protein YijF (DUF1287 family)
MPPFRWAHLLLVGLSGCHSAAADTTPPAPSEADGAAGLEAAAVDGPTPLTREAKIVARAREEIARGVVYDPAYVRLSFENESDTGRSVYPGGDLDPGHGVCTDVVVRAYRAVGVDLQSRVHQDILARPSAYPNVRAADPNIDHRRVGPLLTYLRAHAETVTDWDWRAGDVVVWAFHPPPRSTPDHVGVVSDRRGPRGLPLVVHNIGPRPSEDDVLDAWTRLGHFRLE